MSVPAMDPTRLDILIAALEQSDDLVLVAGKDGRVLRANAGARARWAGAEGSEARALFPDDARAAFEQAATSALEAAAPARFQWGELAKERVRAWFTCSVTPIREGDDVVALLVSSAEVTELKASELRMRRSEQLMVDTQGVAHLGTWEWDVSSPHATWSSELYRIYGLTPEEYTPSYEAYLLKVHPDDRQRVIDATNRVFNDHVPYSHDERVFRPDGTIRYLHTWAFPVLDDEGKLVRLVGVCQDITDRKLAEEEVLRLNADLERRVSERTRDLEAFHAMLSHDLRTPLSVVRGSCSILLEYGRDSLSDTAVRNIERIDRAGAHMTRLVEDLLTLAHVGNTGLERTAIDLSALSDDIVAQLRRSAPDRDVEVVVARGLSCEGDPGLLRTLLENLLGNAWKYSSRTPNARIEVGRSEGAFFVRDNGAGFDMKDAHKLFTPFERLHTPEQFEGTGVGLAAVRRIVERHGGQIWAESAPGAGATFFFTVG